MHREPFTFSTFVSVGHDAASKVLEIEFLNGAVLQYADVATTTYQSLMTAVSPGVYLKLYIQRFHEVRRVWARLNQSLAAPSEQ